ncbi:MAG: FKBP-type peptidyl-prolyl cis-trans isomerase [Actinomycetaceae bacterium]
MSRASRRLPGGAPERAARRGAGRVPRRAGAPLVLGLSLVLAGCGGADGGREAGATTTGPETASEDADADPTEVPGVSVAGAPGSPVVVIDTPLTVTDPLSAVVAEGNGRALTAGGPALLSVSAWDGTTGVSSSGGEAVEAQLLTVDEAEVGATLAETLPGVPEGSRLVLAEPVDVEGVMTMQVVVVDVLPTVARTGTAAAGESGTDDPEPGAGEVPSGGESPSAGETPSSGTAPDGLPTVGRTGDGAPVVGIPPGDAPTDPVSSVVVPGSGATVRPGQELVLQTLTLDWETGEVMSSTWADGAPTSAVVDELAEGLRLALLDRRVGSRVLAVVPPALGDGEHTLVVVVDVLAATGGTDVVR